MKVILTIIICTHNRCDLLRDCVDSLKGQSVTDFYLLIMDNHSRDGTCDYGRVLAAEHDWISYGSCDDVGLSHARNLGAQLAVTEWIGYVDDDAVVPANFVEEVYKEIARNEYDAFGGVYYPWYRCGRPLWFSDRWGGNYHGYVTDGRRELGAGEYFSGGIAFYRRSLVVESQGFDARYGMRGSSIGYGEENVFQDVIRSAGRTLGINPNISMNHLVGSYKLSLIWHLRSQFESGRSEARRGTKEVSIVKDVLYLFFAPVYSLRNVRVKDYASWIGVCSGGCVTFLRSLSYYGGKMWERMNGGLEK